MVRPASFAAVSAAALLAAALAGCFPGERPVAQRMACAGDTCACMAGFGNCDGEPYNGCETDLLLDPRHCGTCSIRCDNGQCVDGECVASEGYVNCNQGWNDGFETHILSDPHSCGSCDHDCRGGSCTGGRCDPFLVTEPGLWPYELTGSGGYLYFCEYWTESIMRLPQSGGEAEVLAVDQSCRGKVAVDGARAYWVVESWGWYDDVTMVLELSLTQGGVTLLGSATETGNVAAGHDAVAWWASADDGTGDTIIVLRRNAAAAPAEAYRTPLSIGAVRLASSDLYFIEADDVEEAEWLMKLPLAGGPAQTVTELPFDDVEDLRRNGEALFWGEWIDERENREYRIMRLALDDDSPTELYRGYNRPNDLPIHADSSGVYWSEHGGIRLLHVPTGSSEERIIAEYQDVESLTSGPTAVFWNDSSDKILGLAKEQAP